MKQFYERKSELTKDKKPLTDKHTTVPKVAKRRLTEGGGSPFTRLVQGQESSRTGSQDNRARRLQKNNPRSSSHKSLEVSEGRCLKGELFLKQRDSGGISPGSFFSFERCRSGKRMPEGRSPGRYALPIGISANTTRLHEKVAWFYRRLCEEYDCPILPQFL